MRRLILAGTSALALCATGARAQSGAAGQETSIAQGAGAARATEQPPAAAEGVTSPVNDQGIGEIIVTATKVSSNLQKVPVAVSTVTGDALLRGGVSSVQQLTKLVPGLQIDQNGSNSSIFIRGVGSRVLSPTADPAVAFSVDGVYYSRASGTSATLFDIGRVEVVKGPQGTLYGRNATGGAINVVTNRPRLGDHEVDATLEIGNYDAVRALAAVNLPLGDNLALRFAGQTISREGYLSDGASDDDTKAGRLSLLFKPSDVISVYASADYAAQGGQGPGNIPVGPSRALTTRFVDPNNPYLGPSDPLVNAFIQRSSPPSRIPLPGAGIFCAGIPFPPGSPPPANIVGAPALLTCTYPLGINPVPADTFLDNEFFGGNLTVDANLGFATLTGIGGFRATRLDSNSRADPGFQRQRINSDQYTAELRLASNDKAARLQWLVGGFYLKEDQNFLGEISSNNMVISNPTPPPGSPLPRSTCVGPLDPDGPGPLPPVAGLCLAQVTAIQRSISISDPKLGNETYAFFGQATYSLTDWLRLTGGIRYTYETKSETNGRITQNFLLPAGVTTGYPSFGRAKFDDTSYRGAIEIDVAPRSMFYAAFSTAFHAGGFNLGVETGPNQYRFDREKIKSYTVGIKNRFFGNRLQLNLEGFWLDYDNYQTQRLGRINDGSVPCSTLNIIATCPFTLRTDNAATVRVRGVEADVVWRVVENGTFDVNLVYNDARFRDFRLASAINGAITDYSGRRLPGATELTISGGYTHSFPLANGGRLIAEARSQYRGDTDMFYILVPGNFQKAYTRTDLSLTYQTPGKHFSITGFVRNLEDKATLAQGSPPDAITGAPYNVLNPPRTYGAILSAHF